MFESLHFVLHSCLLSLELQAYGKSPKQDRMPGTRSSNFGGRVLVRNSAEVASANLRFRNKEMRQRVVERAIAAIPLVRSGSDCWISSLGLGVLTCLAGPKLERNHGTLQPLVE